MLYREAKIIRLKIFKIFIQIIRTKKIEDFKISNFSESLKRPILNSEFLIFKESINIH